MLCLQKLEFNCTVHLSDRYTREHEFAREREVVVRGAGREFEGERDFYSSRGRPELDARVLPVDERRAYEDPAYDRFQSKNLFMVPGILNNVTSVLNCLTG